MKKGYLVLQDGQVFEGFRFGGPADAVGELVFTTGMCGYLETLTDPSYAGQIVMQTYPLIGNYGIIPEDFEGACCVRGYVVREWCEEPSNFRCQGDLDAFLRDRGVPGLWGVDTRELTRIIREHGVMNAAICDEVPADLTAVKTYAVTGVVEAVTCRAASASPGGGRGAVPGELCWTTAPSATSSGSCKSAAAPSLSCLRRPVQRRCWRPSLTASCSPTAPGIRQRTSIRLSRSKSSWARCPCSASAWATS